MVSKKLIPSVMQMQNPDLAATAAFSHYPVLFLIAAVSVISSFVVSITIFLIVNVVINENDSKSILNQIYSYDIEFVNETIPDDASHAITGEDVNQISKMDGVKNTRAVYSAYIDVPYQENVFGAFYKELYQSRYSPGDYEKDISMYRNDLD